MLRFLLRCLANSDQLVTKVAESRPMRRAAQLTVYLLTKTSSMSGTHKLPSDPKEFAIQLKKIAEKYANDIKTSVENSSKQMKK